MNTAMISGAQVTLTEKRIILPSFPLSLTQKQELRSKLRALAGLLTGVKYLRGAEWKDFEAWDYASETLVRRPESLDCSEGVEMLYRSNFLGIPDGACNQIEFCKPIKEPRIGDLAFFADGKDPRKADHVGMLFTDSEVWEVRDFDEKASFPTGQVILRPRKNWEAWKRFVGWYSHPQLMGA